jgi:hypothetical protein
MKLNENGNVELYDWQVRNLVSGMKNNIELLEKLRDPLAGLIVSFIKDDMDTFKKHCGIETIKKPII